MFHGNIIYFGDSFVGKIFFQVQREWIFFLSFSFHENFEKVSFFVSYWNKNKFQSFEMFSKMELLFSSQPYSVCFSFYVLAVLIFRAFGFWAYLHFYGSLITNTSSYLIILLAFFFQVTFFPNKLNNGFGILDTNEVLQLAAGASSTLPN